MLRNGRLLLFILLFQFVTLFSLALSNVAEDCGKKECSLCHIASISCEKNNCKKCHFGSDISKAFLSEKSKVNIHSISKKYKCRFCHDEKYSLIDNVTNLCLSCHSLSINMHAVNIRYEKKEFVEISSDFPLEDGKLVCTTCHLFNRKLCENPEENSYKMLRKYSEGTFCFNCHKLEYYSKYNPHEQVTSEGTLNFNTCQVCHTKIPDISSDSQNAMKILKGEPNLICNGCHQINQQHPTGVNHFEKIIKDINSVKTKFEELNIKLFIGEGGKILCITCHYPHNFDEKKMGLVKKRRLKDKNGTYNICNLCHSKFK